MLAPRAGTALLIHSARCCKAADVSSHALQALSGPAINMDDPVVGLLFSLVAASAHVIVPAAVFNLKVWLLILIRSSHDVQVAFMVLVD